MSKHERKRFHLLGRVANPRPVSKIKTGLVSQPITDADDETDLALQRGSGECFWFQENCVMFKVKAQQKVPKTHRTVCRSNRCCNCMHRNFCRSVKCEGGTKCGCHFVKLRFFSEFHCHAILTTGYIAIAAFL